MPIHLLEHSIVQPVRFIPKTLCEALPKDSAMSKDTPQLRHDIETWMHRAMAEYHYIDELELATSCAYALRLVSPSDEYTTPSYVFSIALRLFRERLG
jgi:hypothetical protein